MILLGNAGVGKTSLAYRWTQGRFSPNIIPTVGVSSMFNEVTVGTRAVRITLWDTAGQEQFRVMMPLYIRDAKAAIVVAAADNADSFHAIPTWLDLISGTQEEPIPSILAVNKSDVLDPLTADEPAKLIDLYRSHFEGFFCVSALSGAQVDDLFKEAARVAGTIPDIMTHQLTEPEGPARLKCC
jgi:small GTP-binding protein